MVIKYMSIQTNVPALAMEKSAPLAVSDVAMLAPEEVFSGKGDVKEEAELTQVDRKRRRASKKRKLKECKQRAGKEATRKHRDSWQWQCRIMRLMLVSHLIDIFEGI